MATSQYDERAFAGGWWDPADMLLYKNERPISQWNYEICVRVRTIMKHKEFHHLHTDERKDALKATTVC